MSDANDSADDISRRMQRVRREVRHDVQDIVQTAKTLTDWRYHVKHHPWVCAVLAGAVGYMLIPKRKDPRFSESTKELMALLKKNKLRLDESIEPSRKGLFGTLLAVAVPALARTAMAAATRHLAAAAQPHNEEHQQPGQVNINVPR